jgi:hypothetical protein
MRWLKYSLRFVLVTGGIIVLTSLGIDATQFLDGSQSALGILARKAVVSDCPAGMTLINATNKSYCIDTFEASVGESCIVKSPVTALDSKKNIDEASCQAESVAQRLPWTSITYLQAKETCAKRGGRLPNNYEWFEAALGTPDTQACNINGELKSTGSSPDCKSPRGTYDAVGNAWEWIDETVVDGKYQDRQLPTEGYVNEVDQSGVATQTSESANPLMNDDYFWINNSGPVTMMRGGFYGSGKDGGLYAIYSKVPTNFSSGAISFRCVIDK